MSDQKYLLCPNCKWPFRWDGIGSGGVCPSASCKTYVKAEDSLITEQEYYEIQKLKLFQMRTGDKYDLSKYDYIHRNCGGAVVFKLDSGAWKCPKCKLLSHIDGLLEPRPKGENGHV